MRYDIYIYVIRRLRVKQFKTLTLNKGYEIGPDGDISKRLGFIEKSG